MSSSELAERTGTAERYIREWLSAQAACGYLTYDPETIRFSTQPEQAMVFADEKSPVFLAGFFAIAAAAFRSEPKLAEAFKSGRVSAGMSMMAACSAARSASSAQAMSRISPAAGCPHLMA